MAIQEWANYFKSYVNELNLHRDDYKDIMGYIDDAVALLKEQPEIVRCKDCKYWHDSINCPLYSEGMLTDGNWFCADGERR